MSIFAKIKKATQTARVIAGVGKVLTTGKTSRVLESVDPISTLATQTITGLEKAIEQIKSSKRAK